jgi:hypothetical protein
LPTPEVAVVETVKTASSNAKAGKPLPRVDVGNSSEDDDDGLTLAERILKNVTHI